MTAMKPVSKMTKKERKAYYSANRGDWNGVVPVTKVIPNKKKEAKYRAADY